MDVTLTLLGHQFDFVNSEAKHTVLVGGFGSGKTEGGISKAFFKLISTHKKLSVCYYLPNYPLINDVAVPRLSEIFEQHGIKFKYNGSEKIFTTRYGKILLRNLTRPETIVGYEVFFY